MMFLAREYAFILGDILIDYRLEFLFFFFFFFLLFLVTRSSIEKSERSFEK